MCWFCTYHVFVYVVLLLAYLVILPWVGCLAHHVLVCLIWASSAYWCYLIWLFEILMDNPILGEWYAWALHNLKMCAHEEYYLELILQVYLVSMWYVILMRNSNSIMSINSNSNCLSHYGGVICFVHITSLENVNIWGFST
jgi:hypothetical protein